MKLMHQHFINEKRDFGRTVVNQIMYVIVEYNKAHHEVEDVIGVEVWENGKCMEISKLLDKAEGNPLSEIIDAIDWEDYAEQYEEFEGNCADYDTRRMISCTQQAAKNYPNLHKPVVCN